MRRTSADSSSDSLIDVLSSMLFIVVLALLAMMLLNRQATEKVNQVGQSLSRQVALRTGLAKDLVHALGGLVSVDRSSGNVQISEEALTFKTNSAAIGERGRQLLRALVRPLAQVAFDPRYRPHLRKIVVEGHTDSTRAADRFFNWNLSSARALAVMRVILAESGAHRGSYEKVIEAGGLANRQPLLDATQREDRQRSRRIEIKVLLDDRELIQRFAQDIARSIGESKGVKGQ